MASLLDAYDTIIADNPPPVAPPPAVVTQHFTDNNRDSAAVAVNPPPPAAAAAASSLASNTTTPSGVTGTSPLDTPDVEGDLLTFPSPPCDDDTDANMFADSFGSDLLNDHGGSLEENNCLSNGHDHDCKICQTKLKSPRVLSCLHVFCEICIAKLCATDPALGYTVECPICKQITKIGAKGVASLHCDYVATNILDLSSTELRVLACTSCKGKENAISRCNDCANILCASCDNAHQSMRCFENHKVVKLEDLVKASSSEKMAIHKPLFCTTHVTENLNTKGADHVYEMLSDAEKCVRIEVENLMKEARGKVEYCDKAACHLGSALTELQTQHDVARDLIEESYQSFKAVLEKCRDNALKELKCLHSERELKIMDVLHNVEKSVEKIENACNFTKRVLEQANAPELLSLKKLIGCQFLNLVSTTPKADSNYSVEFHSNFDNFERLAQEAFGKFQTEACPVSPKECTPPPTLPGMPPILISGNQHNGSQNSTCNSVSALTGSVNGTGNSLISRGPSPGVDNILINEFTGNSIMPNGGGTSLSSLNDDLTISNFQSSISVPGRSKATPMQIRCKFGSLGASKGQFNSPHGFCLGVDEEIIVADTNNHRIEIFEKNGAFKFQFGVPGKEEGQLWYPRKVAVMRPTYKFVVCDRGNERSRMQIFNKTGHFMKKIAIRDRIFEKNGAFKFQFGVPGKEEGQLWYPRKVAVMRPTYKFVVCDRGNERSRMQIFNKTGHFMKKIAIRYIDIVAGLAVTNQGHIVAVDSVSPTVFIITEEGDLVHWFDCSNHMREPSDIAISGNDFYVCDFKGHCVAVFTEDGTFKYRIGNEKVTCFPNGIDISDAGDILIGDSHGNRFHVACFSREGVLQSEYECPYVKVSPFFNPFFLL
uniref:Uncharacterized protein n=2 Tax=Lutzomyia longipalpis TaxID=7200 RepID=A0A1B0GK70_LUTLO